MSKTTARLAELKVTLPAPATAAANYVPFTRSGNLVHIAGQLPKIGETMITGTVGKDCSPEQAKEAAKMCAINLLAQAKAAAGGDLDRVKIIKLNVFVNSAQGFGGQPAIANGASDFVVAVFGEAGRHARSAVGVAALPFNVAVEIDGVIEVQGASKL